MNFSKLHQKYSQYSPNIRIFARIVKIMYSQLRIACLVREKSTATAEYFDPNATNSTISIDVFRWYTWINMLSNVCSFDEDVDPMNSACALRNVQRAIDTSLIKFLLSFYTFSTWIALEPNRKRIFPFPPSFECVTFDVILLIWLNYGVVCWITSG